MAIKDPAEQAVIKRLAARIANLEADMAATKRTAGTPQLTNASITGGAVKVIDADGTHKGSIGTQPDGTFAVVAKNGAPPPPPSAPAVVPGQLSLTITWDGLFAEGDDGDPETQPADFDHVQVHLSTTSGFTPDATTLQGTLRRAGSLVCQPLVASTTHYVLLVGVNTSGIAGDASASSSGVPEEVVATDVLDGIITTLKLADDAVTNAKIANTAVDANKLADGSVSAQKILDDAITAAKVNFNARDIGGVTTSASGSAPTSPVVGDVWIDTLHDNAIKRWNGTAWVAYQDPRVATAASDAASAIAAAAAAQSAADVAQATADGAVTTWFQSTPPTGLNNTTDLGDMWFDTDTGQAYHWDGTDWVLIEDNQIAVALAAAQSAQTTADGKIKSYFQGTEPTGAATGDLWYNTAQDNRVSWWDGSAWQPVLIGTNAIADAAITADQLGSAAVTTAKIATAAITAALLSDDAVTAGKLADGSIDASTLFTSGVVDTSAIKTSAITSALIAANTIVAGNISAGAIGTTELAANAVTAGKIAANTITAAQIQAATITATQIAGDTITAAQIAAGAISTSELAANAVTAAKIAADTITANEIASSAIGTNELAANAVTAAKIAANTITASLIAAGTITANEIATDTITASQIAAGAIGATELAANSVIAGKIAAGVVDATAIASGAVTTAKLDALAVTADKIAANAITAGKIEAGAVTAATLAADAIDGKTITGATILTDSATGGFFVYSGTPAAGNLIVSIASDRGTDAHGNSYPQGMNVLQGEIDGATINAATLKAGSLSSGNIGSSVIVDSEIQGGTLENVDITFDSNGGALLVYASTTVTQTFTSSGSFTVPAGVTSLKVECWGGGGGGTSGGNGSDPFGGTGGGGGGYAKVNALAVTPGNSYSYVVGAGGSGGAATGNANIGDPGGDSSFNSTSCVARGGSEFGDGGGDPSSMLPNIGDVTFIGGRIGFYLDTGGVGGGGSAGPNSSGHNSPNNNGTGSGSGATAVSGGGAGGAGGAAGAHNGSAGTAPGGGGGGGGGNTGSGSVGAGGSGARGQVKVTYLSGSTLIASISGVAGTDQYGNSYPAGISGVIGGSLFAAKSADESVTSSTTLQNDNHLVIPVAAGATYTIDGYLQWIGDSAGDIKFAFAFPSGSTLHWGMIGPNDTDTAFAASLGTRGTGEWFARVNQTTSSAFIQYSASTAALLGRMSGLLITGGSAGDLQLQWAQFVSNTTATTLKAGSWLKLERVA